MVKRGSILPIRRGEGREMRTWSPFEELDDIFERMRRDMELAFRHPFWMPERLHAGTREPRVDMIDTGKAVEVHAELPGISKEKVDVNITNDAIEISGSADEERKEEHEGYYCMERQYTSYHRRLPLPDGIDPDKAEATMENGLLKVVIPKTSPAKEKKKVKVK